jgi:hypothetical protein
LDEAAMALTGQEPDLALGDSGEGVVLLQIRLYGLGLFPQLPDGAYGMTTEDAVRQLQSQLGLDTTGTVDRDVWAAVQHAEDQYGIQYQAVSPYDALDQLVYDLQQAGRTADGQSTGGGQLSPDGQWRWDGYDWQPAGDSAGAQPVASASVGPLSEDGQWRWDGYDWQPAGDSAGAQPVASASVGPLSEDGQWRWDGYDWQPVGGAEAAGGRLSADGRWRWDGQEWQPAR